MTHMPAPIAVAWREYTVESHPFPKLHRLVDTYEAVLKYATVLAVQNFYTAGLADQFAEVDRFIRDKIARPHLGEWTGLLCEVLRCFAEREQDLFCRELFLLHFQRFGANPTPQAHCTDQGATGRLLTLRNALAHGATLPDEESTALLQEHEQDLRTLLDKADFFTALPLYHIEAETAAGTFQVRLLMSADYQAATPISLQAAALPLGHVVVHNPHTETFLDLHPLLVCTECLEQVPQ